MKQSSFSDLAYEHKKKTTRKERFLGEMEAILPWDELLKPIEERYPTAGQGRQPIPAAVMLRIYFLQQWYGLSDPGMEDSLYDVESMRRFAGVELEAIPDESTILKFRHFLDRHSVDIDYDSPVKLDVLGRLDEIMRSTRMDVNIIDRKHTDTTSRMLIHYETGRVKNGLLKIEIKNNRTIDPNHVHTDPGFRVYTIDKLLRYNLTLTP